MMALKSMLESGMQARAKSVDYQSDPEAPQLWFRVGDENIRQDDVPTVEEILADLGLGNPAGQAEDGFISIGKNGRRIEYNATPVRGSIAEFVWHIVFHMPGYHPRQPADNYRPEIIL